MLSVNNAMPRAEQFFLDTEGMCLDLTELSSYLPLVSSFEFGNVCGKLFPCTEGRVRTTTMTSAGTAPPWAVAGPSMWLVSAPRLGLASHLPSTHVYV